ncbi:excisionase family DNA-binding protein [Candidatus Peregrinibacteria bacterium]|nr:excisionase family DNA-binding protein [Candidatus Peregrinibacteria bacterium]MBT7483956.1 excisionase family DNA-binding protein [Candidatus Peregrinibacteria bacterium]MBT7703449.1 excisionase family DNA-binding protein [Candidatus Peregrinibacteria bacterium]
MGKRLYTAEQVSKILQVHHLTVLKLIKQKKLKAVKVGRVYRITEAALNTFIDNYST